MNMEDFFEKIHERYDENRSTLLTDEYTGDIPATHLLVTRPFFLVESDVYDLDFNFYQFMFGKMHRDDPKELVEVPNYAGPTIMALPSGPEEMMYHLTVINTDLSARIPNGIVNTGLIFPFRFVTDDDGVERFMPNIVSMDDDEYPVTLYGRLDHDNDEIVFLNALIDFHAALGI